MEITKITYDRPNKTNCCLNCKKVRRCASSCYLVNKDNDTYCTKRCEERNCEGFERKNSILLTAEEIDKRIESLLKVLDTVQLNYEKFCSSGCSVHEFNRLQLEARFKIKNARIEKNSKLIYNQFYLELAEQLIGKLSEWVGKRIPIMGTSKCLNCELDKKDKGYKWFCIECDK